MEFKPIYSLQAGEWPIRHFSSHYQFDRANMIFDNEPGSEEAVAYPFNSLLNVVDAEGKSWPGWPVDLKNWVSGYEVHALDPVMGDIDGDGDSEILAIVVSYDLYSAIFAWHMETAELVSGWPILFPERIRAISLADLDDNGSLEVIASRLEANYGQEFVYAFHGDGTLVDGWPAMCVSSVQDSKESIIAVGDIDADGDHEIVVTFGNEDPWGYYLPSPLFVYGMNGDLMWKTILDGCIKHLCLGDLDEDPELEIVIHYYVEAGPGCTAALNHDGSALKGWENPVTWKYGRGLAVSDIDRDGLNDVILSANGGLPQRGVMVLNGDSSLKWVHQERNSMQDGLLVADVFGDDRPEILIKTVELSSVSNYDYISRIEALNWKGERVLSIPIPGPGFPTSSAIGDIDRDGDVEILCWTYHSENTGDGDCIHQLFAWDLIHKLEPDSMDWPMFLHDCRHSALMK